VGWVGLARRAELPLLGRSCPRKELHEQLNHRRPFRDGRTHAVSRRISLLSTRRGRHQAEREPRRQGSAAVAVAAAAAARRRRRGGHNMRAGGGGAAARNNLEGGAAAAGTARNRLIDLVLLCYMHTW
jgi:hypothetical protein